MENNKRLVKTKAALDKLFKAKNYLDEKYFPAKIEKKYTAVIDKTLSEKKKDMAGAN